VSTQTIFLFGVLPKLIFDFLSKNFLVLFLLFLPYFNYKYNRQTNTQNHQEYVSEIQKSMNQIIEKQEYNSLYQKNGAGHTTRCDQNIQKSCIKRFVNSGIQPYLQVYPYHNEYLEP